MQVCTQVCMYVCMYVCFCVQVSHYILIGLVTYYGLSRFTTYIHTLSTHIYVIHYLLQYFYGKSLANEGEQSYSVSFVKKTYLRNTYIQYMHTYIHTYIYIHTVHRYALYMGNDEPVRGRHPP